MERNPGKGAIFFYGLLEFIMYPKERLRHLEIWRVLYSLKMSTFTMGLSIK
uniref:Alternative protein APBB1IP n=1 Tax=Homo sapiens TaxID=9606 RepID=L8EB04_HUMAN|nr:alternative protein APBB1IP [Homo sapiens]